MATSSDIANNASYVGNSNLGGGNFGVISLDTKPLENLAYYTMLYNKQVYDQKQKETDQKIKDLADLSNISLNDLRGKDKEQATKEFTTLLGQAGDYARKTPKTQQERIQNELKWQEQYGAFKNNYGSGKARSIAYQKQLNDINSNVTDAKLKEGQIASLNKKFDSTDIGTPISAMEDFKLDKVEVPKPNIQIFDTVAIGSNEDVVTTAGIFNPMANLPAADATIVGIKATPQKGSAEYNALSDLQKQQADAQNGVQSSGQTWAGMAEPLNSVLKNYVNADGSFDHTRFEDENASNTTVMNAYNAVKNLSDYSTTKKQEAQSGQFNDRGLGFKLPPNLKPTDFNAGIIDFTKGVTPTQLVLAAQYAQFPGDKFEKKLSQTDNAIQVKAQKDANALGWAKLGLDKDEFGLKQKQFEQSQKGSQTQVNGATERAKRIYADLQKLADSKGFISPDKLRQLNVEQLKYLGVEQPKVMDSEGKVIDAGGFKPLDLSAGEDAKNPVQYGIKIGDGNIQVMKNPKADSTRTGGFVYGEFDNTKSTNVFNVATNILNEELKNAGSKELNSYWGVDVTNAPTQNTDVQTKTTTSSATSQNTLSTSPADWKKVGQNWQYKDGSIYDSKGNKIK